MIVLAVKPSCLCLHAGWLTLPVSTSSSRCLMVSSWLGLRVRFLKMLISASQSGGAGSPSAWGLSVMHRLLLWPLRTGIMRHVWHGCCPAMECFSAPWADPAPGLIVRGMSTFECCLLAKSRHDSTYHLCNIMPQSPVMSSVSFGLSRRKALVPSKAAAFLDADQEEVESPVVSSIQFQAESERLQDQGNAQAAEGNLSGALGSWNRAIQLTPGRAVLHEQRAQVSWPAEHLELSVVEHVDHHGHAVICRCSWNWGAPLMQCRVQRGPLSCRLNGQRLTSH